MNIEILSTKSNLPTMKIDGYYIHSSYNPLKEAEKFAEKHYVPNTVHILYGYGLGYFAKELYEKFQFGEELLVIDPFQIIEDKDERIYYIDKENFDEIDKYLALMMNGGINVNYVESPNYNKFQLETYAKVLEKIRNRKNSKKIENNTLNSLSNLWFENIVYNLYSATNDSSFKKLENKFDVPIVIAAGGPSLTKQLDTVKKYRDNMILISAGSTVNSLIQAEIIPDYIVNIDGSKENIKHYKELSDFNIPYIYGFHSTHEIRKLFSEEGYYFGQLNIDFNDEVISDIFERDIVSVNGGTSVAVFCLSLAVRMTTGPIALIGQDLAYTNNISHAKNNRNYKEIDLGQNDLKKIKGYYDDVVLSDPSLISMKEDFEMIMSGFDDSNTIFNCTEGGAKINHMAQMPFEEFCSKYAQDKVSKVESERQPNNVRGQKYINYLKEQIEILVSIQKVVNNSLLILKKDKLKNYFEQKNVKILSKNNRVMEEKIAQLNAPYIIEKIALSVSNNFLPQLNETKEEEFKRIYHQQSFLYESVIEHVTYMKETIQKLLNTIE